MRAVKPDWEWFAYEKLLEFDRDWYCLVSGLGR